MIASERTARTSSGVISGSGFAIGKIIGFFAMVLTMSLVTAPLADRPMNTSAPSKASASVRFLVLTAKADLNWSMPWVRPS